MKRIKLFEDYCNEGVVKNIMAEITVDDLKNFSSLNIKDHKQQAVQDLLNSGDFHFTFEYDWKEWEKVKVVYDYHMNELDFKYCYNIHAGHDSFLLAFSNVELPGCEPFDAELEFKEE